MITDEDDAFDEEIIHYGVARKSGRYPYGSGENPNQRHTDFLATVKDLENKGLKPAEIAKGLGMSTNDLRAKKAIAKDALKQQLRADVIKLADKKMSNVAIGNQLGINESSVRALRDPVNKERQDILKNTADVLRKNVEERGIIDVGIGVENYLGISREKLATAVAMLKDEGYAYHRFDIPQVGTGLNTNYKVLAPKGTTYPEVLKLKDNIKQLKQVASYSEDDGRTWTDIEKPRSIDSKKIMVRYGPDGGADKDGVIELRRGVDEISLGGARYSQVRIAVDDTHYLKGMAMYSDNMPDGVDIIFNSNKSDTGNKLDALKPMKTVSKTDPTIDEGNPFGSVVRQRHYTDKNGKKQLSAMNIVYEEGDWLKWTDALSSQMLSKQSEVLAKEQLGKALDSKKREYEEIMALTNPAVKKKMLESFADDADSAAVKLKAAALPRQGNHVILPLPMMKETEIYAPNYNDGERVVLIRHPHGGKFEIPELVVNNRQPEARKILGRAKDGVGIHPKVAERLSGADFDGDTVLVIPNNHNKVQSSPALKALKDFDPKTKYKEYPGMKIMSDTQKQMGDISNLITDMTIKGANDDQIARAVAHSMVVIDAEKHRLNYKQSYIDNNIAELKQKYQWNEEKGKAGGASTLISRASSEERVGERKPRRAKDGGPINAKTGEKEWDYTGNTYTDRKTGKTVPVTISSTKMAEAKDARTLSSGTDMEEIYAAHANGLKMMANEARKSWLMTPNIKIDKSAKEVYKSEVASLDSKLYTAIRNKPLERQAQVIANAQVKAKVLANPSMPKEDLKKIKGQAQRIARARVNAKKENIEITPREWEAIQNGAISNNKLMQILNNTDMDRVKELATPRDKKEISEATKARARTMMSSGKYTQSEIANALGISTTTLNTMD